MAINGVKPDLKPVAGALGHVPSMPASLPADMRGDWMTIASDLCGRGLFSPAFGTTLEAYLRSLWMTRKAQEAVEKHGFLVKDKINPAVAAINREQQTIARLAAELGLTPSTRSRPGFQKIEAEAADAPEDDLGLG